MSLLEDANHLRELLRQGELAKFHGKWIAFDSGEIKAFETVDELLDFYPPAHLPEDAPITAYIYLDMIL